ncbi:hypothetical protein GXW82_08430 [Streptacidiphilus sp. 4-A2]|nr:hypothetical protein [Streptacidiphilus sp. 4-A2]
MGGGVRLARSTYQAQFGADIAPAPGAVLVLTDQDLRTVEPEDGLSGAVAGLNFAGERRLFCEYYLDAPVEDVISALTGEPVSRSEIVEVGPLASTTSGAGSELISLLGPICWCNGAKAAVFTVTRPLHVMLRRMGIRTQVICHPREEQLPERMRGSWGSYYEMSPVMVYTDVTRHMGEALSLLSGRPRAVAEAGA